MAAEFLLKGESHESLCVRTSFVRLGDDSFLDSLFRGGLQENFISKKEVLSFNDSDDDCLFPCFHGLDDFQLSLPRMAGEGARECPAMDC